MLTSSVIIVCSLNLFTLMSFSWVNLPVFLSNSHNLEMLDAYKTNNIDLMLAHFFSSVLQSSSYKLTQAFASTSSRCWSSTVPYCIPRMPSATSLFEDHLTSLNPKFFMVYFDCVFIYIDSYFKKSIFPVIIQ